MEKEQETLRPADRDGLVHEIGFALRYSGRKRRHDADAILAHIVADRIVEHLERSRYVVMQRPPDPSSSAPAFHLPMKD